jgi:hypothetical protein
VAYDYSKHEFHSKILQKAVDEAVDFFNRTHVHTLPPPDQFIGPGVYGLYYVGGFELYKTLSDKNKEDFRQPIYIGKAVPSGWRTGRGTAVIGKDLYRRLREHSGSINLARNLDLDDFRCRFMILKDYESNLISTVEAELIRRYRPPWNTVVDGFGNHDPGSGRYNQAISEWDVLHPGREWATRLTGVPPQLKTIIEKVNRHLE